LANIIVSLTVHLCFLAHGMVSDAAILRTDARLAAPAGLSFECANVQVCKPPAPVPSASTNVADNWLWC
jgi:hypothetical protein